MILFLVAAGVLLAGALWFVLPPLMRDRTESGAQPSQDDATVAIYRDQLKELDTDLTVGAISEEQYGKARTEIERRVLDEVQTSAAAIGTNRRAKGLAAALAVGIPLFAGGLYLVLGNPRGLDARAIATPADETSHALTPEQIVGMVDRLAARLKENPGDPQGWVILGRSYSVLQRHGEAAQAYAKAFELTPNDAQLIADYADALAMAQGRQLDGEPARLVARALQIDPNNIKALALAGSVAFQAEDYAAAGRHWRALLAQLPEDSELAASVRESLAEVDAKSAKPPAPTLPSPAIAGVTIRGTVSLAAEFAGKVAPDDTVFVFAWPAEGPRMPVAMVRKQVRDLPFDFLLDDAKAISPDAKLSTFARLVVGARVSKSGDAAPRVGDLQGSSSPVAPGARNVVVTIDTAVK